MVWVVYYFSHRGLFWHLIGWGMVRWLYCSWEVSKVMNFHWASSIWYHFNRNGEGASLLLDWARSPGSSYGLYRHCIVVGGGAPDRKESFNTLLKLPYTTWDWGETFRILHFILARVSTKLPIGPLQVWGAFLCGVFLEQSDNCLSRYCPFLVLCLERVGFCWGFSGLHQVVSLGYRCLQLLILGLWGKK